jgi:uncharacterized protein (TIGR02722 family)
MNIKKIIAGTTLALALLAICGCAANPRIVTPDQDTGGTSGGLDSRDFQNAASTMLQDLFRSHRLENPNGGRYVMEIGRVKNDTSLRGVSSDQIIWTIKEELTNSGLVAITSAVSSGNAGNVNAGVYGARELRGDAEFNQASVQKTGTLIAPDLSISGQILQRDNRLGNTLRTEYYFQLKITDLKTGMDFWQKQTVIVKEGSSKEMRRR